MATVINVQTLANEVKSYSQIVAKFGPDSIQASDFRQKRSNDEEFLAFAGSLDQLHRNLKIQKKKSVGKKLAASQ